jgi:hypothetical protein
MFESDELLLLSLGINPKNIKVVDIYNLGSKCCGNDAWKVLHFTSDRRQLFDRQFNKRKISPKEFLEYVDFVDFPVEQTFLDALRKIHQPGKLKQDIDPREKTSLLQI